jgi:hypothetical protein
VAVIGFDGDACGSLQEGTLENALKNGMFSAFPGKNIGTSSINNMFSSGK